MITSWFSTLNLGVNLRMIWDPVGFTVFQGSALCFRADHRFLSLSMTATMAKVVSDNGKPKTVWNGGKK